jgi:hypothetical protein
MDEKKGLLCHIGQAYFFLLKLLTSNSEKTIKNDKNSKRFTFSKILKEEVFFPPSMPQMAHLWHDCFLS